MVKSLFPLACIHTLGNVLTNLSLTKVSVAFTHTVKARRRRHPSPSASRRGEQPPPRSHAPAQAAEPFFSVLLSWIFLGTQPHPLVLASLVPIVSGVALASFTVRRP